MFGQLHSDGGFRKGKKAPMEGHTLGFAVRAARTLAEQDPQAIRIQTILQKGYEYGGNRGKKIQLGPVLRH